MWCTIVDFFCNVKREKGAKRYFATVLLPFPVSDVPFKVCCHVHVCLKVMSSLKLSNITNSMQYSTWWMCLQWVWWIVLLKNVSSERTQRLWFSTGKGNVNQQIAVEAYILALCSLLDPIFSSSYRALICHFSFITRFWFSMYIVMSSYLIASLVTLLLPMFFWQLIINAKTDV